MPPPTPREHAHAFGRLTREVETRQDEKYQRRDVYRRDIYHCDERRITWPTVAFILTRTARTPRRKFLRAYAPPPLLPAGRHNAVFRERRSRAFARHTDTYQRVPSAYPSAPARVVHILQSRPVRSRTSDSGRPTISLGREVDISAAAADSRVRSNDDNGASVFPIR